MGSTRCCVYRPRILGDAVMSEDISLDEIDIDDSISDDPEREAAYLNGVRDGVNSIECEEDVENLTYTLWRDRLHDRARGYINTTGAVPRSVQLEIDHARGAAHAEARLDVVYRRLKEEWAHSGKPRDIDDCWLIYLSSWQVWLKSIDEHHADWDRWKMLGSAETPNKQNTVLSPVNVRDLLLDYPDLRPAIVDGLIRRGETANIIAAAKVGKSHLAMGLAWCVATGMPWLSHEVAQGRVLILDNELHPETLASRIDRIATAMQIDIARYGDQIDVICLRGMNVDIHKINFTIAAIKPGQYSLVIVDALYRTLPEGTSENDNAAMMAIYNQLDYYAGQWDCAIAVIHHASKGQQGDKSVTDVGSGAGSISRAADTHIVIRPHEQPDLSVLEVVTRSFRSPEAVSIRFDYPVWQAVTTAPAVKKIGQRNEEKRAIEDKEADTLLLDAIVANAPKALSESQLVRCTGMGPSRVSRAIGRAIAAETVSTKFVKRQGRKITTYVKTATPTATDEKPPS
jgi:hypothetical protein